MANASISIVIVASTAPQAVENCFRAIAAQTLQPVEVIIAGAQTVLDPGSLRRSGSTTTVPLRVLAHANGASVAEDLNAALPLVRGEFVACVEAGELCPPDFLARLATPIDAAVWTCAGAGLPTGPAMLNTIVESGHVIRALLLSRDLGDRQPARLTPSRRIQPAPAGHTVHSRYAISSARLRRARTSHFWSRRRAPVQRCCNGSSVHTRTSIPCRNCEIC